jgi:uncharacterized protein (TIGR02117 family)
MGYLKAICKALLIVSFSILLLVAMYIGSAYVLSRMETHSQQSAQDVPIYILTNGVHTDIVMPIKTAQIDWSKEIRFENTRSKDSLVKYVALGWGDKGFYLETPTWADLKASTALKAAFWLGSSAVHATFYQELKEGADCKRILISKPQYAQLINYIHNTLTADKSNHPIHIKTNAIYGLNDAFYEANGTYSLFHTCNTWANDALKSCGQKACIWTPFDTGIFYHYNKN